MSTPLHVAVLPSPVGALRLVASPTGLRAVLWPQDRPGRVRLDEPAVDVAFDADGVLADAAAQIGAYFSGERRRFAVPLDARGTGFQRRVWDELAVIPYGETRTYADVAAAIGSPSAVRAVAGAIGRNPLSIIVPCHRVLGRDGSLTGFAGGLDAKRTLLRLEGVATTS